MTDDERAAPQARGSGRRPARCTQASRLVRSGTTGKVPPPQCWTGRSRPS